VVNDKNNLERVFVSLWCIEKEKQDEVEAE